VNAADVVARLVEALGPVADQLPDVTWRDATWDERLPIRSGQVALTCPARAALDGDEPFETSPAIAGPAAALAVIDRLALGHRDPTRGGAATDLLSAFRVAYKDEHEQWPWDWAHQASEEQRVLLAGAATRRAAGIARMLDPWPPPALGFIGYEPAWFHPQRPLRLKARFDAVLGRRDGSHTLVAVLAGDHGPATRRRLAYDALLEVLSLRRPPARVLGLLPDAGRRWSVPVDDGLIDEGIAAAADAARSALGVQRRDASGLERRPGPGCRSCAHAVTCDGGAAWLAGPGRLRLGFLSPGPGGG
jgi:hypothetical protein